MPVECRLAPQLRRHPGAAAPGVRDALAAIRETSKGALAEMRVTLSDLRAGDGEVEQAVTRTAGLARLDVLCDAVRAAGAPVRSRCEGEQARCRPRPTTRPTGSCRSR